jgi:hypothetical protein
MPKWPAGLLVVLFAVGPLAADEATGQNGLAVGGHDDQQGANVLGAFADSLKLLLIEHGTRIALQEKTRSELRGNFWADYNGPFAFRDNGTTPIRGWSITPAIRSMGQLRDTSGSTMILERRRICD